MRTKSGKKIYPAKTLESRILDFIKLARNKHKEFYFYDDNRRVFVLMNVKRYCDLQNKLDTLAKLSERLKLYPWQEEQCN